MRILVTGGAGYIGSHTLLKLLELRHNVVVLDNFANSSPVALERVQKLTNTNFRSFNCNIQNEGMVDAIFTDFKPDAVVHFAGLKSVGESHQYPLRYYDANVAGTMNLLKVMANHNCKRIVFSSSATVYGEPQYLPYDEKHPLQPSNTYGRTKYFSEGIIRDWASSLSGVSAVLLRYFNPVGAHASGNIGEDPNGIPNNLVPYIAQVAVGNLPFLNIHGMDYDTRDGSGERDYIHVEDLARAHVSAVDFCMNFQGCDAINIGTGYGTTVLEMVKAFEQASGQKIRYKIGVRRPGDVAQSIAGVEKARHLLGWQAELNINDMCSSIWNWQSKNPNGYTTN